MVGEEVLGAAAEQSLAADGAIACFLVVCCLAA